MFNQLQTDRSALLIVLSAPSGIGKDTGIRMLQQQGIDFYLVTSITTRAFSDAL